MTKNGKSDNRGHNAVKGMQGFQPIKHPEAQSRDLPPADTAAPSCAECGSPMILDENEVSHHVNEDGRIDYGADADHVAIDDTGYAPVGGEPAPDPDIDMWRETPGNVIMFEPMPPGTPPEWKGAYVKSTTGASFNVRYIPAGSKQYNFATGEYTRETEQDVVAFYDARYPHTPHGQHVSTYYVETLLDGREGVGLNLHGGVDDWTLDPKSYDGIKVWLEMTSNAEKD